MAKKSAAVLDTPEATTGKPVKGQKRLNKDGTPFTPSPRRPNDVIIAEWQAKRAATVEKFEGLIAKIDKKIEFFANRGSVDPAKAQAAAAEMLGNGMTVDQIAELRAKLAMAEKAIKKMSPEEIEALQASKPAAVTYDDEDESEAE